MVGSVHIQNSLFTYNTGNFGGNARFEYTEDLGYECTQLTDTLLCIENSFFAYGENWSTQHAIAMSGGVTLVSQSSYNINVLVTNTTLHGNRATSGGGNMFIYFSKEAHNLISVTIEHCYITQGEAWRGGGLYVEDITTTQCVTEEPQHTLHITDVHFVNNTATTRGGGIYILDDCGVGNHINISNSSIIGGKAQTGGGVYVQMGQHVIKRKWNDSEYCNSSTTRISVWSCDIQNNFATESGGGFVIAISEINSLAPQSTEIFVMNTTLHGNQASVGGGNMMVYYAKEASNLISVSIQHCYITQGRTLTGGGLYVEDIASGDEPYQCGTGEPLHTLHITDVHFMNNTAHRWGGNIFVWEHSSVCSDVNISNSSIIGGKAQTGGGVFVQIGRPHVIKRKWNASEYCNSSTCTTRISVWNCDIQNNFATSNGGGLIIVISGFNSLAPHSHSIGTLVTNTTLLGNRASVGGGNMMISYNKEASNDWFISVSIQHCYIFQGEAVEGGGLYVSHIASGDEPGPFQCGTGKPQRTLHITNVHFVKNTAYNGGGIFILDDSGVCNHINISNSSIIGGKALFGGGLSFEMGEAQAIDRTKRKWNDSEYYSIPTTRISVKRWTIWNCDIQNNFATVNGGGLIILVLRVKLFSNREYHRCEVFG